MLGHEVLEAMAGQVLNQAARSIVQDVSAGRNDHPTSSRRWIWELLQNAVDSTAESGDEVDVAVSLRDDSLVFEHAGGPFTKENLGALITGGSSKPLQSARFTGQFGSGFLVSHVLSHTVLVEGVFAGDDGQREFTFLLDRSGETIEAIRANIDASLESLNQPPPAALALDGRWRARFSYRIANHPLYGDNPDRDGQQRAAAAAGLRALEELLPYVFCFAPRLRSVTIRHEGERSWHRTAPCVVVEEEGKKVERIDLVCRLGGQAPVSHPLLVARREGQDATCAVRGMLMPGGQVVVTPPLAETPKIFRTYPLSGSARYGLPVVLHAEYAVDEKRREIYLGAETNQAHTNRQKVSEALSLLPYHAATVTKLRWDKAHLLARVSQLAGEEDEAADWWGENLKATAESLAKQPLVLLDADRLVPAIGEGDSKDDPVFPLPLLSDTDPTEAPFSPIWSLMDRYFSDVPPEVVAADWQAIVRDWERLGVSVRFAYTTERLVRQVRSERKSVSDLARGKLGTQEGAITWLRDLLAIMADHYTRHGQFPDDLLAGILPDQHGELRSPRQLARDLGIDDRLKDIAQALDPEENLSCACAQLLHEGLTAGAETGPVPQFLKAFVQREQTQEQAINVLVAEVSKLLPLKSKRAETDAALSGSIDLLAWFAQEPERYAAYARRIPLLSQEGTLQAAEDEPAFLLPLSHWDERTAPYQKVFPERRILAAVYAEGQEPRVRGPLLTALVTWRLVRENLLDVMPCDLDRRQVGVLRASPAAQDAHKVSGLPCRTLPFLNEVQGGTANDRERARLLLGLILNYVIHVDDSWRTPVAVSCTTHPPQALSLYPCKWLAALRLDKWIASEADAQGNVSALPASRENLDGLIHWPEALGGDLQVEFLARMGFDALDLNIRRQAGESQEVTQALRRQMADLVAVVGGQPETYAALIAEAHQRVQRQKTVSRNQTLGLHVERLVRRILADVGFSGITVRHRGRDIEAFLDSDLGLIDVGPFSFEVKASKGDEVRMSPAQAEFVVDSLHRGDRVLCVVDLRDVTLPEDLTTLEASEIEPVIFIVDDVGQRLQAAYESIQQAVAGTDDVRVENVEGVRYCVQRRVWEWAPGLSKWVARVRGRLAADQGQATAAPALG